MGLHGKDVLREALVGLLLQDVVDATTGVQLPYLGRLWGYVGGEAEATKLLLYSLGGVVDLTMIIYNNNLRPPVGSYTSLFVLIKSVGNNVIRGGLS